MRILGVHNYNDNNIEEQYHWNDFRLTFHFPANDILLQNKHLMRQTV